MGVIIDSCKRTVGCGDSDDESGYKRKYTHYIASDSDNGDNADDDNDEPEERDNKKEIPQDLEKMKIKTNSLFMQRHQSPWEFYEELEELGVGNYGVVKKVRLIKNPDIIRAMKIIPEENVVQGEGASLIDEIEILKNLEHPNIMKVYESFVDNNNYYIVSELCDQGHLLSKMEKLERMDQIVVKFLMDQILNAVAYLHSKNILHGDIKLENVLLYKVSKRGGRRFTSINEDFNEDEALREDINQNFGKNKTSAKSKHYIQDMMNYEIKLIDFGCSKYFVKKNKKKKKLSGIIGTSIYCSPEVVDNLYDEKCDEWSCGVLMYILLGGIPPFYGDTEEEIFEKIKKCEYDFSPPPFKKVSKNCKDLIRRLLEPKKQYRIKANEALRHPFFTESFDPNSAMTENNDLNILKRFINPIKYPSKFHEVVVAYLCVNFIPDEEEKALKTVFRYLDKENKSIITKDAMKQCLEEIDINIGDDQLQQIFDSIDEDGSGLIEYQEFIRNACDIQKLMTESNLKNIFHAICGDKEVMNGEDIKKFVFHDSVVHEQTVKEYFEQIGINSEDIISFEDFSDMIKNNTKLREKKDKDKEPISSKKKHESRYAFTGPIIDEKEEEDDGGTSARKKYKEDEDEEERKKENKEVANNGIEKHYLNEDDKNGNEKLNTVADSIENNDEKLEKVDEIISK